MFRTLAAGILLLSACVVNAGEIAPKEIGNPTVSAPSEQMLVCQAAMESRDAAKSVAVSLKIGRRELSRIRCNEMTVMDFAKLHSNDAQEWSIATVQ